MDAILLSRSDEDEGDKVIGDAIVNCFVHRECWQQPQLVPTTFIPQQSWIWDGKAMLQSLSWIVDSTCAFSCQWAKHFRGVHPGAVCAPSTTTKLARETHFRRAFNYIRCARCSLIISFVSSIIIIRFCWEVIWKTAKSVQTDWLFNLRASFQRRIGFPIARACSVALWRASRPPCLF